MLQVADLEPPLCLCPAQQILLPDFEFPIQLGHAFARFRGNGVA